MSTPRGSKTNTPLPLNDHTGTEAPSNTQNKSNTKSTEQNTTGTTTNTTANNPLSTISPALFDVVPALHQVLSRLLPAAPLLPPSTANYELPPSYTGASPLDIPGLSPATSGLMVKLQRARAGIRALPDIERSVAEQQEEIGYLNQRVEKLNKIMADMRDESMKIAKEEEEEKRKEEKDEQEAEEKKEKGEKMEE